jgi:DNA invertase Pin-like site-specific DNA recombinase
MARAIGYVRVSKEREGMISPELQLAAITRHCEEHGHTLVAVLEDLDLTGRFWKRRQVEEAVAMIERGEADVLVVWKLSRLSRNRVDWNIAVDRVEGVGGRLESATEPMDTTTSSGRFARGVMAELAAFESERIGETWKESHSRRIERGLPHHGRQRFGYAYSREKGYVQDPVTAPVLRDIYMKYIAGAPLTDLAALSGSYGGPRGVDGLRYALDWGFGAGKIRYREQTFDGAHEGVITEDEFKMYQRARKARAKRQRAEPAEHPFSGILVCWCGQRMWGNARTLHGQDHSRYLCAVRDANGHTAHTNSIAASKVEAAVLEWLAGFSAEVDAEAAQNTARPRRDPSEAARRSLEASLSKAAARMDTLTEKFIDGEIDKEVYDRLGAKLRAERASLEERLDELEAKAAAPKPADLAPDLLAAWGRMPNRVKRQILSSLLERITVGKAGTLERLDFKPK